MSQTKPLSAPILQLPAPERKGRMSLEEALAARRSVREFRQEPITDRELSQLLRAAQGITSPDGLRTAPRPGRSIHWRSGWRPPPASITTNRTSTG